MISDNSIALPTNTRSHIGTLLKARFGILEDPYDINLDQSFTEFSTSSDSSGETEEQTQPITERPCPCSNNHLTT